MAQQAGSTIATEGDDMFTGFASRIDPANLPQNVLQISSNMRLQRGVAEPRKGTKRLTDSTLNSQTMVGSGKWVDSIGRESIVLVFTDRMYLYRPGTGVNSYLSPAIMFPSGRTIAPGGQVDVVRALDKLYLFRGREVNRRIGTGTTSGTSGVRLSHAIIASGATGSVTATCVNGNTHYLQIGDEVTVFNVDSNSHLYLNNTYIVTGVTGNTVFTFNLTNTSGGSYNAASNVDACCVGVKPPLVWDGVSSTCSVVEQKSIPFNQQTIAPTSATGSVPPADFGFYFQNRLVCKITRDQLAVSDILSSEFDFTLNNFTINQGGNDEIVGVLPWIEDQFLVFMKQSIYIAFVETSNYAVGSAPGINSSITVVTTEVGCAARRTITPAGQFVFFLSNKGVHMLTPQLDLKLLGNTLPLSEPISDVFDNLTFSIISNAVAAYYENRFYIALPGQLPLPPEDVTRYQGNNLVLVYNTLNQAWESKDSYPYGLWIDDFHVCQYNVSQRRLFITTNFEYAEGFNNWGGVFLCEENIGGDQFSGNTGNPVLPFNLPATITSTTPELTPINAYIRTREYTFGSLSEKRYSRAEIQFNNSFGDIVSAISRTHDPDTNEELLTYTFTGSADGTLRPRIAARGTSIDVTVYFISGRPALKGVTIYSIMANRAMVTQE